MRIVSGVDTPMTSGSSTITYNHTKAVNASNTLYYEAVPFEMLRTYEEAPQVFVTVSG